LYSFSMDAICQLYINLNIPFGSKQEIPTIKNRANG
jgi:hypothetical protein